jgi:hypothetical protein
VSLTSIKFYLMEIGQSAASGKPAKANGPRQMRMPGF